MHSAVPHMMTYDQLYRSLVRAYDPPEHDFALRQQISSLQRAFPSPLAVRNLRLLDLGCGCQEGTAETSTASGTWAPWLCRAVTALGGAAVGVDIGFRSPKDTFEFHRIDLSRDDSLSTFADRSFDIINCTHFFSSPHLIYRMGFAASEKRERLAEDLEAESLRLLKPGGVLLAFDKDFDNY